MVKLVIPKPKPTLTPTDKDKASLKASAAWHEKPKRQPKPIIDVMVTKRDFAAWTAQYPAPAKTFGIVLRRWLGSKATVRGVPGFWAAWAYPEWSKWTGVSVATFKRHLDRLEEAGLLDRELHRHGGTKVLAYIRPTPLALTISNAHPNDWKHLGQSGPVAKDQIKPLAALEATYRAAYLASQKTELVTISKGERTAMKGLIKQVPDLAINLVDITVRDWSGFTVHVVKATGFPSYPHQPSITYIMKHLQSAADFTAKHQPKSSSTHKEEAGGWTEQPLSPVSVGNNGNIAVKQPAKAVVMKPKAVQSSANEVGVIKYEKPVTLEDIWADPEGTPD